MLQEQVCCEDVSDARLRGREVSNTAAQTTGVGYPQDVLQYMQIEGERLSGTSLYRKIDCGGFLARKSLCNPKRLWGFMERHFSQT